MIRRDIENLSEVIVKTGGRNSQTKLYTTDLKELEDVEEFQLNFTREWCDALVWIWVTDDKGQLVLEPGKEPFGPKQVKSLKKRVKFRFMEND